MSDDEVVQLPKKEAEEQPLDKKKKKRNRAQKENNLQMNFQFSNKPKGISSNQVFVGQHEADGFDVASGFDKLSLSSMSQDDVTRPSLRDESQNGRMSVSSSSSHASRKVAENLDTIGQTKGESADLETMRNELYKLRSQLKIYQKETEAQKGQLSVTTKELEEVRQHGKIESKKLTKENEKLKDKVNLLQTELSTKDDECHRLNCEKSAFFDRVQTLEKEKKAQNALVKCDFDNDVSQKHRAICAEITVLTLQKNFELEMKERIVNDIKKTIVHLDTIISKCTGEDAIAAGKYQEKFDVVMRKLESEIKATKKEFDDQIDQIKDGANLKDLKRIRTAAPPTPPPLLNLKLFERSKTQRQAVPVKPSPAPVTNTLPAPTKFDLAPGPRVAPQPPIGQFYGHGSSGAGGGPPESTPSHRPSPYPFDFSAMYGYNYGGYHPQQQHMPYDYLMTPSQTIAEPPLFYRSPLVHSMAPSFVPQFGAPPVGAVGPTPDADTVAGGERGVADPRGVETKPQRPVPLLYGRGRARVEPADPPGLPATLKMAAAARPSNLMPKASTPLKSDSNLFGLGTAGNPPKTDSKLAGETEKTASNKISAQFPAVQKQDKISLVHEECLKIFPSVTQQVIKEAILEFRNQQPEKKLSGLKLPQLISGVKLILERDFFASNISKTHSVHSSSVSNTRPSSSLSNNSLANVGSDPPAAPQQRPDECFICFDILTSRECLKLECGHEAHKQCLDGWITEKKTCPICRKLTLSEEDFPRLY